MVALCIALQLPQHQRCCQAAPALAVPRLSALRGPSVGLVVGVAAAAALGKEQ